MLDTRIGTLIESVTETLETMAFIMAMPAEEELDAPQTSVKVSMDFDGPSKGSIELMAGHELVELFAANLLGIDPDDEDAHLKHIDAFKELLNTICGILLPKFATDENDVFNISIPKATNYESVSDWDAYIDGENVAILDCDYFPMAIKIIES